MPRRDPPIANPPLHDKHQRISKHQPASQRDDDRDVDAMSEDSFPASDPPSIGAPETPEQIREKQRQQKLKKSTPHRGSA